jgi:adenosylhomocysteine nucleosidase
MRILFVASDRMEFTGILRHTAAARPEAAAVDWARSGRLNANDVLLVANGVGRKRAASAVDAALHQFPADAVVSTGFCGALDEELGLADVVVANRILATGEASSSPRLCASASKTQPRSVQGPICSVDHVVRTAEEKRQLRATGACAVEMEAAGVASRAQYHGLPFFCVRSVTDLAGETLANDFNAALRADGHFDTMFILGQVFRHPGARLPELLRLRGRCTRAARVLGDFFADCRY